MAEHTVEALWVRTAKGASPEPREALTLVTGQGIEGDHTFGRKRHITLLFADDWRDATDALGQAVDPSARRANVLLTGGDGQRYLGQTLRLGDVVLEIQQIVDPCSTMDEAAAGLRAALEPAGRGGIWGRVVRGGTIRPNDTLEVVETADLA